MPKIVVVSISEQHVSLQVLWEISGKLSSQVPAKTFVPLQSNKRHQNYLIDIINDIQVDYGKEKPRIG